MFSWSFRFTPQIRAASYLKIRPILKRQLRIRNSDLFHRQSRSPILTEKSLGDKFAISEGQTNVTATDQALYLLLLIDSARHRSVWISETLRQAAATGAILGTVTDLGFFIQRSNVCGEMPTLLAASSMLRWLRSAAIAASFFRSDKAKLAKRSR
jgi:hypothetical protein